MFAYISSRKLILCLILLTDSVGIPHCLYLRFVYMVYYHIPSCLFPIFMSMFAENLSEKVHRARGMFLYLFIYFIAEKSVYMFTNSYQMHLMNWKMDGRILYKYFATAVFSTQECEVTESSEHFTYNGESHFECTVP